MSHFHFLAIMNNAAMNMSIQISLETLLSIFQVYTQKWDCWILFLIFWGNIILFFIVATLFYTPINSAQGFQFLHILTNTCDFLGFLLIFLISSHLNGCEGTLDFKDPCFFFHFDLVGFIPLWNYLLGSKVNFTQWSTLEEVPLPSLFHLSPPIGKHFY